MLIASAYDSLPGAHVTLVKFTGGNLFCSWSAQNTGGQTGRVALQIDNVTMLVGVARSSPVDVVPGGQVLIQVGAANLQSGVNMLPGTNQMLLHMVMADTNAVVAQHSFLVVFTA